jgi:dUTPase
MFSVGNTVEVVQSNNWGFPVGYIGKITVIETDEDGARYQVDDRFWHPKEELKLTKTRGFEVVSGFEDISLPRRQTTNSAGYDFEAAEEVIIMPGEVQLVPTGVKAYMQPDEYLGLHIRSSLAVKQRLTLINAQGIVDADYYNNPSNEGHIQFAIVNHSNQLAVIEKGQRIGQGIFYKFLKVDDDEPVGVRTGGTGSTGE